MKLKFPKKINLNKVQDYFEKYDLKFDLNKSKEKNILKPDLVDLYFIHNFIILNKRINILEIGTGWSSYVISNAHLYLLKKYSKFITNSEFLIPNFKVLDNNKKYLKISKNRNKVINNKYISYFYSKVEMTEFNNRYCTRFVDFPKINPELIYLDGPSQYGIKKNRNFSFNTDSKELMPMVSDILKIEHFLSSGTVIISDGRKANINFLVKNFQREWKLKNYGDRSILLLNDSPLGYKNKQKIKFYYYT